MAGELAQDDPRRGLTLGDVLGHEVLRSYLRRAVVEGSLPQAILFAGPSGVGKRTMAWALAREIVAAGEDALVHRGSLKIQRGTHPDVMAIGASSASGQIRVDDIRDLIDWTARYPIEAGHKIGIIVGAERMNEASANALLKLLEEPPPHLRLILTSPDPARMLVTIRSRCTPLILEPVALETLVPWLSVRCETGVERARLAAKIAEGRPGYALDLLAASGLESRERILRELILLAELGFASIFGVADRLLSVSGDAEETLRMASLLLRDALWIAMGRAEILNDDMNEGLSALSARVPQEGLFEAARLAEAAASRIADYYLPAGRAHFVELTIIRLGQALRKAA